MYYFHDLLFFAADLDLESEEDEDLDLDELPRCASNRFLLVGLLSLVF